MSAKGLGKFLQDFWRKTLGEKILIIGFWNVVATISFYFQIFIFSIAFHPTLLIIAFDIVLLGTLVFLLLGVIVRGLEVIVFF